jgi:hypothetical protein
MTDIDGYYQPHCYLELTDKEQKVIQAFKEARPGLGEIAERNIRNNDHTGWADIIASSPDEELVESGRNK